MMDEVWKFVPGYESRYLVSNTGKVYSLLYQKELKPYFQDGYSMVKLKNGPDIKTAGIHRVVADAFIPNPEQKEEVNHINGDKQNNSVTNLEWATRKENVYHAIRTGLRPLAPPLANAPRKSGKRQYGPIPKPVAQYETDGTFIRNWSGASEAAKALNGNQNGITKSCRTGSKYMGYVWEYI